MNSPTQLATFAGGCFWCLDAIFSRLKGVEAVAVGYIGGTAPYPSYEAVCEGRTGHAEAVQCRFDPSQISYKTLLEVFFSIHDPTTLDRQGIDIGTQYRSAVFWHSVQQEGEARAYLAQLNSTLPADHPAVTMLCAATRFYPAEAYHKNYFATHPHLPYCAALIAPKLAHFTQAFSAIFK